MYSNRSLPTTDVKARGCGEGRQCAAHTASISVTDENYAASLTSPPRRHYTCPICHTQAGAQQGKGAQLFLAHPLNGHTFLMQRVRVCLSACRGSSQAKKPRIKRNQRIVPNSNGGQTSNQHSAPCTVAGYTFADMGRGRLYCVGPPVFGLLVNFDRDSSGQD